MRVTLKLCQYLPSCTSPILEVTLAISWLSAFGRKSAERKEYRSRLEQKGPSKLGNRRKNTQTVLRQCLETTLRQRLGTLGLASSAKASILRRQALVFCSLVHFYQFGSSFMSLYVYFCFFSVIFFPISCVTTARLNKACQVVFVGFFPYPIRDGQ